VVETQRHCGDAKNSWFEEGVTVDPQRADVERLFRFPLTGKIAANKRLSQERSAAAEGMIEKLRLNAPSLVARRRNLLALAAQHANEMTRIEWVNSYIAQRPDGSFQEFWSALHYNYTKIWTANFEP
jgi:hypothetical protein